MRIRGSVVLIGVSSVLWMLLCCNSSFADDALEAARGKVAAFTIGPSSYRLAVGTSQTFTATAKDEQGQIVKMPPPTNRAWEVSVTGGGAIEDYVFEQARGGDGNGYTLTLLGVKAGTVHLKAKLDLDGTGKSVLTDERDVRVRYCGSYSPDPSATASRHHKHDALVLGSGFDSATGMEKQSPFEYTDPIADVRPEAPGTTSDYKVSFSSEDRVARSGAQIDLCAEAKYMVFQGSTSASFNIAREDDASACCLNITYFIDKGHYRIDRTKLMLRKDAAEMLAVDPKGFRETYGDRFVLGDYRWSFVTAKFSSDTMNSYTNVDASVALSAKGEYGPVGGKIKAAAFGFLSTFVASADVGVHVYTNADADLQVQEITQDITKSPLLKKGDTTQAAAMASHIGEIAGGLSKAKAVEYDMETVPMSWVIPSFQGSRATWERVDSVEQHMHLHERLFRQLIKIDAIVENMERYFWYLSPGRKQALRDAQPVIHRRYDQEEAIVREWAKTNTAPTPPDGSIVPVDIRWPEPGLEVRSNVKDLWLSVIPGSQAGDLYGSQVENTIHFKVHDVGIPHVLKVVGNGSLIIGPPEYQPTRLDADTWECTFYRKEQSSYDHASANFNLFCSNLRFQFLDPKDTRYVIFETEVLDHLTNIHKP